MSRYNVRARLASKVRRDVAIERRELRLESTPRRAQGVTSFPAKVLPADIQAALDRYREGRK